jgi:TetR/AcrR family transcriptional regulator, regulator of cefoperazone and chloramphenicol sensitivity
MNSVRKPAASNEGYRKGEESRQRILNAALKVFGAHGFKGATTRQIAEDAEVNLPALQYYFGDKEGLYRACAREIVSRYEKKHMLTLVVGAYREVQGAMTPVAARARLKEVMSALASLLVDDAEAEIWSSFVLREMADRGPAFAILYEQLWAPGVELTSGLVSRALGERSVSQAARIEALLLISSLSAFSTARPVSLKYLQWPDAGDTRFARVRRVIEAQIDRIGSA